MPASTPLILRKSRMRRRARTDLCVGRSVMIVPTATVVPGQKSSSGKLELPFGASRFPGWPTLHRRLKIRRVLRPSSAWAGPLMLQSLEVPRKYLISFSSQTPSEHHHRLPTARRRQWRSTRSRAEVCPSPRRTSNLPQPHYSALFENTKLRQSAVKPPCRNPASEPNKLTLYSVIFLRITPLNSKI